jgi:predicted Zn-dependent protease
MKKNSKHIVLVALLAVVALGVMFLSSHSSAQFDLKELEKGLKEVEKYEKDVKDVTDAFKPWTYPEERATGQVVAAQVASHWGLWKGTKDAESWMKYVNAIGRGLVFYCPRPDIKYRFAILNTDEVNAFAAPGGYIFVTRGILKMMNNEASLAAVLAHEIGHVAKRHVENTVKAQQGSKVLLDKGIKYAAMDGKIDAEAAKIAKEIGNAGVDVLMNTGYSQAQEFEADKVGTETMAKMGYSPAGMRAVLKKLEKMSGSEKQVKRLFSTHPAPKKRKDKVKDLIEKKGLDTGKPIHDQRYLGMLQQYPIP